MARGTEFSYPQAGKLPADGTDCGAYTDKEWQAILLTLMRAGGMVNTGAAAPTGLPATPMYPDVGVFYVCPNRLEVTSSGAALISIATGAYLCDGKFGYNNTVITDAAVTVPVGGANSRIDRVVVRQNYSGATYTPTYVPSLTVPANTARITVISGAEAAPPVAPNLTQDQDRLTYWDIPLAQYSIIHTTGVISALTDQRDWVDAETKSHFVQAVRAYNVTDGAPVVDADPGWGWVMPDNKISETMGSTIVPQDFISSLTLKSVYRSAANGNVYVQLSAFYGACGQAHNTHFDAAGYSAIAVVQDQIDCINSLSVASAAAGDILAIRSIRDAVDALDTVNNTAQMSGWVMEYLGWGRK